MTVGGEVEEHAPHQNYHTQPCRTAGCSGRSRAYAGGQNSRWELARLGARPQRIHVAREAPWPRPKKIYEKNVPNRVH